MHRDKPRDEIAMRRSHRNSVAGTNGNCNSHLLNILFNFFFRFFIVEREDNSLSLGSVGSRRTVYLSEDEPPNVTAPPQPPLLVYNRISTVIGEAAKTTTTTQQRDDNTKKRLQRREKRLKIQKRQLFGTSTAAFDSRMDVLI